MKIRTEFIVPPIPDRRFDWCAIDDDTYDGSEDSATRHQIGYGRTEEEAIADLKDILEEAAVTQPHSLTDVLLDKTKDLKEGIDRHLQREDLLERTLRLARDTIAERSPDPDGEPVLQAIDEVLS